MNREDMWFYWGSSITSRPRYRRLMKKVGIELERMGSFVGAGAEGEVWEYGDKVLKLFMVECWEEQKEVFERLRGKRKAAKVYGCGRLDRKWGWMICERLEKLEGRYSKVLRQCNNNIGNLKRSRMEEMRKLGKWLERLPNRTNLGYYDLHDENVMQRGKRLVICDLNGFYLVN